MCTDRRKLQSQYPSDQSGFIAQYRHTCGWHPFVTDFAALCCHHFGFKYRKGLSKSIRDHHAFSAFELKNKQVHDSDQQAQT
jgi:hypothetical protein